MVGTQVWAWPVKRAVFARLGKVADGDLTYAGTGALRATSDSPVQVELFLPPEPDRVCVFGTPISFSRRETGGESGQANYPQSVAVIQVESVRVEVRVRVYEPGDDFWSVDTRLGDVCSAVVSAVLAEPFGTPQLPIRMGLTGGTQDPTAMSPGPDPYVIGNASLTFTADVVTF